MSELKTVALTSIKPNPFRDLEQFPLLPEKVAKLRESIDAAGFWEGVIVRPVRGGYEQAFGHHRIEAARLAELDRVPVIVRELTDDEMLHFMNRENAEEHGWDFYNTSVQEVRAAVLAFGAGKVAFQGVDLSQGGAKSNLRVAPSFAKGVGAEVSPDSKLYTAQTLAEFLGRVKDADKKPQREILTALDVLEMLEAGDMKPRAIVGLTHAEAREVVGKAKDAVVAARAAAEAREAAEAKKRAAAENMKKLDAERAQREYAAKVKREGEEKARKEREELAAATKRYQEEQAAAKRAAKEAAEREEREVRDARAKALKDTVERLRVDTVKEIQQERKIEKRAAPNAKPLLAVDLTARGLKVVGQLEGIAFPADIEPLLTLAYDPTHVFPAAVAKKMDRELLRIEAAARERRKDLKATAKKRGWTW